MDSRSHVLVADDPPGILSTLKHWVSRTRRQHQQTEFDLVQEISTAARHFESRLTAGKTLKMRLSPTPAVTGLPDQIAQIARSLIAQAFEAVGPNGQIVVSTGTVDGDAVFTVDDNGRGMSDETARRLFSPFFATGSSINPFAAAHEVLRAHGGRITVSSEPGKGTTFEVTLPPAHGRLAIAA
jgi:signal transduction histidine kinase